ncbi:MAG: excinuclease ABC subunit C [Flavobacteriales bacterium]|mgnify:CR=1 FL=1|nr:excinuclease ABC subunit C [Flavobacteriales bacterium]|tara:strand:+ start:226 stop:2013 length:1788 start_codon:yes stop_codon:yes gene_type:complete
MTPSNHIQEQLQNIPQNAGVYQYFDKNRKLLYVGKAKNLRKRISSYFNKKHEYGKTRVLVRKIYNIQTIVVASEIDALLLENSLIKKHQPQYNVLLKDDKTYPWICIKNEAFPRVFSTRKLLKDGSDYFGPYTSMRLVKTLLEFTKQLYPLRTCNYVLSQENIQKEKFKVCLEYHIGNCKAPCVNLQNEEDYQTGIQHIKKILNGDIRSVIKHLQKLMQNFSRNMAFEQAQMVKEKIALLENYQAKSTIVNPKINDVDVFSIVSDEQYAYVNFFKVASGAIIQSYTLEMKKKLAENDEELLTIAMTELRQRFKSTSKECYTSIPISSVLENLKISVPKIGDKRKLVELSYRNAKHLQMERLRKTENIKNREHNKRLMEQMQSDLYLKAKPLHIECFDNSNIQGSNPVAACVVFKNGKPSKKEYRHFNIKTVSGPDDFASMEEVVYRRYSRLVQEGKGLPQLIIIDGGKGQLSSAVKSLERLGLMGKVAIIGIAKKLEEIFFPNDSVPLYLDKRSETLKVIQQARNEAHRFGINHHRNQRSKNALHTSLDKIPGIGPKTIKKLISHFGSVKRIMEADEKELINLVGVEKTKLLKKY